MEAVRRVGASRNEAMTDIELKVISGFYVEFNDCRDRVQSYTIQVK